MTNNEDAMTHDPSIPLLLLVGFLAGGIVTCTIVFVITTQQKIQKLERDSTGTILVDKAHEIVALACFSDNEKMRNETCVGIARDDGWIQIPGRKERYFTVTLTRP